GEVGDRGQLGGQQRRAALLDRGGRTRPRDQAGHLRAGLSPRYFLGRCRLRMTTRTLVWVPRASLTRTVILRRLSVRRRACDLKAADSASALGDSRTVTFFTALRSVITR